MYSSNFVVGCTVHMYSRILYFIVTEIALNFPSIIVVTSIETILIKLTVLGI
jgi:hypothetical protein